MKGAAAEPDPEVAAATAPEPAVGDAVGIGEVNIVKRECKRPGPALTKVASVTPARMPLGGKTTLTGKAVFPKDLERTNFTLHVEAGLFGLNLIEMTGD